MYVVRGHSHLHPLGLLAEGGGREEARDYGGVVGEGSHTGWVEQALMKGAGRAQGGHREGWVDTDSCRIRQHIHTHHTPPNPSSPPLPQPVTPAAPPLPSHARPAAPPSPPAAPLQPPLTPCCPLPPLTPRMPCCPPEKNSCATCGLVLKISGTLCARPPIAWYAKLRSPAAPASWLPYVSWVLLSRACRQ